MSGPEAAVRNIEFVGHQWFWAGASPDPGIYIYIYIYGHPTPRAPLTFAHLRPAEGFRNDSGAQFAVAFARGFESV